MSAPLDLAFVTSASALSGLPDSDAEVAIVGRSNVGKSSLLNALGKRRNLAYVSKTPGRTQLLNCFSAGEGTTVVDCPGYGYAAVSKATRAGWQPMIEGYLRDRDPLTMVMVLVDGEIGPTKLDGAMLSWLRQDEPAAHRDRHQARQGQVLAAGAPQARPGRRLPAGPIRRDLGQRRHRRGDRPSP